MSDQGREWPVAGHDGAWIDPWVATGEVEMDDVEELGAPLPWWRLKVAGVLIAVADWCADRASGLIEGDE